MDNFTKGSAFPHLVRRCATTTTTTHGEDDEKRKKILNIECELSPPDPLLGERPTRVNMTCIPVEIVTHRRTVDALLHLVNVIESSTSSSSRENVLFGTRTTARSAESSKSEPRRRLLEATMSLSAPVIVLPRNPEKIDSQVLVFDLGRLTICSDNNDVEDDVSLLGESCERRDVLFQERWNVNTGSTRIVLASSYAQYRSSSFSSSMYLLEEFRVRARIVSSLTTKWSNSVSCDIDSLSAHVSSSQFEVLRVWIPELMNELFERLSSSTSRSSTLSPSSTSTQSQTTLSTSTTTTRVIIHNACISTLDIITLRTNETSIETNSSSSSSNIQINTHNLRLDLKDKSLCRVEKKICMTLSPMTTRIESTSCLDLCLNSDQCVDLQRVVTLLGVASTAQPIVPTKLRLTHFLIEHSGEKDFMIHFKDTAEIQVYDLHLCMSELRMIKSCDHVYHVTVSDLKAQNIASVRSLEIRMDTHESTRYIKIDMSNANITWCPNRLKGLAYAYWNPAEVEKDVKNENITTVLRVRTQTISLDLKKDNVKNLVTKSIEILEFDSIDVDIDVSVLGVRVVSHERNNSNNHTTQETVNSNRFQQHIQIRAAGQMLGLKSNTLLPSQLNLEFDHIGRGFPNARLLVRCTNSLYLKHFQQRLLEMQDYVSPGLLDVVCALCGSFEEEDDDSQQDDDFRIQFFAPHAVLITPNGPRLDFKKGIRLKYTDTLMDLNLLQCFLSSSSGDVHSVLSSDLSVNIIFATSDTPTKILVNIKDGIQWKNVSKTMYEHIVRFIYHNVLEDNAEHKVPAPLQEPSLSRPSYIPFEASTSCIQCSLKFSEVITRHHCRRCGALICRACSCCRIQTKSTWANGDWVCVQCWKFLAQNNLEERESSTTSSSSSGIYFSFDDIDLPPTELCAVIHVDVIDLRIADNENLATAIFLSDVTVNFDRSGGKNSVSLVRLTSSSSSLRIFTGHEVQTLFKSNETFVLRTSRRGDLFKEKELEIRRGTCSLDTIKSLTSIAHIFTVPKLFEDDEDDFDVVLSSWRVVLVQSTVDIFDSIGVEFRLFEFVQFSSLYSNTERVIVEKMGVKMLSDQVRSIAFSKNELNTFTCSNIRERTYCTGTHLNTMFV